MKRGPDLRGLPDRGYGFALVKRGGIGANGKANTRMAFLVSLPSEKITGYLAYIGTGHLDSWTKSPRMVWPEDIVKRWKTVVPTLAQIRAARAAMQEGD